MAFRIGIWDHCRYVTDRRHPYDEMARHLELMRRAGVTLADIYLPEVISLDDYCRAAQACGMKIEARITPAWAAPDVVNRTLPESAWCEMEKRFGIRLAGPCGNRPDNREKFVNGARRLLEEFAGRLNALHLDFIRNDNALLLNDYPCQCEICRQLYQRYFGCAVPDRAMLAAPAVQYKLVAIRNANITQTVRAMHELARRHDVALSIAARANYVNSADITAPPVWGLGPAVLEGQDWVNWLDDRLIDSVYPMNYHTDLKLFETVLNDHRRLLGQTASTALHPGVGVISSMGTNSPEALRERLAAVKAAQLPGAMLFNKTNVYDDAYRAVIREFAEA